jgi:hypothetical protein
MGYKWLVGFAARFAMPGNAITCSDARYIKFGGGGTWTQISLNNGELHFGYAQAPHELGLAHDRQGIKDFYLAQGLDARRAAGVARQVTDFYGLGADCLWITFANGDLWWAFAAPEVKWLGPSKNGEHGERVRKSIGGWRNTDVNGKRLAEHELSTKLTQVKNYRQTICEVRARDYLLRKINGHEHPLVLDAQKKRQALITTLSKAICELNWADFETLVDIVFARSGWHRTSAVGGKQKTIDLELEQPTTGERIAVQVKSKASQKTLLDYIKRTDALGSYDRLFFVCHSPTSTIEAPEGSDVHVWTGAELAANVMKVGLHDWVLEKIA